MKNLKLEWIVMAYLLVAVTSMIVGQLTRRAWLASIGGTLLGLAGIAVLLAIGAIVVDRSRDR